MGSQRVKIIIVSLLHSLFVLPNIGVGFQTLLVGEEKESLLENYQILLFVFAVY
ncbi:hypothetical protein [Bacillus coreaensis]